MQKDVPDEEVEINGVVNLKTMPVSHYKVSLNYGDLTLIVAILRDYVMGFDQMLNENILPINEIEYEAYYRKKFLQIADRISEQIEYDYDKMRQKCIKKAGKVDNSDIGEEALVMAMKKSRKAPERKEADNAADDDMGLPATGTA